MKLMIFNPFKTIKYRKPCNVYRFSDTYPSRTQSGYVYTELNFQPYLANMTYPRYYGEHSAPKHESEEEAWITALAVLSTRFNGA